MESLFFRPTDAWVGDLIPYFAEGTYYLFYLHDPRKTPGLYAEQTTWHLATTKDFASLTYRGESLARGGEDKPNRDLYTGSVIRDHHGRYHAFYTAYNPGIQKDGRGVQFVMKATGDDLRHLETVPTFVLPSDDSIYEPWDWRDPFVFWNESDGCYWMLITTREKGAGAHRGGCLGLCKSADLETWTYERPFYSPRMYITMECSEVFQMGGWWYLVFSTFSDQFVTHYRMARDLAGPWTIPSYDTFDGRAAYALKTASDGRRRFASGWIASKQGSTDEGAWDWGGTMVHHELVQNPDSGELTVRPPEALVAAFSDKVPLGDAVLFNAVGVRDRAHAVLSSPTLGAELRPLPHPDTFSMNFVVTPEQTREFGVALHCDEGLERGYFLRFDLLTMTVAWDRWPRSPQGLYQWQIQGDIPFQIETLRRFAPAQSYAIRVIREADVCVVYVNDAFALSYRMYNFRGGHAGLYVVQGQLRIEQWNLWLRK